MRTIKRLALSHEFRDLPLWLFVGLSINELESERCNRPESTTQSESK